MDAAINKKHCREAQPAPAGAALGAVPGAGVATESPLVADVRAEVRAEP